MSELIVFGLITGFLSGFFGIGGGMVLIPMLLWIGFSMKESVSMSIIQMVFSSIYGSILNFKNKNLKIENGLALGIGGFIGGFQNSTIHHLVSNDFLELVFIFVICFSIYKIASKQKISKNTKQNESKILLLIIGFFIGVVSMSIGVGGSVLLIPILYGYMHYDLKDAATLGLFFVIFSSVAGFISLSTSYDILYSNGFTIGIASLIGVYFGIKVKNIVNISNYKKYILTLNITILLFMLLK